LLLDDPLPLDPDIPELLSRLRSGELDDPERDDPDDPDEPWSFLFRSFAMLPPALSGVLKTSLNRAKQSLRYV